MAQCDDQVLFAEDSIQEEQAKGKNMSRYVLRTGDTGCYDAQGKSVSCAGSLQDGALQKGIPVPQPRFQNRDEGTVLDRYTGLCWPGDLSGMDFPLRWSEALDLVSSLNREGYLGHSDWRMPNRRELRSLIWHSSRKPALPPDHPFAGLKLTWYWTSTSSAMYPAYAWHLHLEGGRMFWGKKNQFFLLLPVRSSSHVLPRTGQGDCFSVSGKLMDCSGSGQDGETACGVTWPQPRFEPHELGCRDRLTDLIWHPRPGEFCLATDWEEALHKVQALSTGSGTSWRLPNINELESLVDASRHTPALPGEHPFPSVQEVYWSSTTSGFETDWAFALYMHKGAVGVGRKSHSGFAVWPVTEPISVL